MTYKQGNHAERSERWRYIRYADRTEELYDHKNDAQEHHNVAELAKNAGVIDDLKKWLPQTDVPPAPDMRK